MKGLLFLLILISSCQPSLDRQPRLKTYQKETFFKDQRGDRSFIEDTYPYSPEGIKKIEKKQIDRAMLERGKERFEVFCMACHGRIGNGEGIVTQHGFTPPPSFHTPLLRNLPDEHYFEVITNGMGRMTRLGDRITPEERWEIISYIRALQLSQYFPKELLTPKELQEIDK